MVAGLCVSLACAHTPDRAEPTCRVRQEQVHLDPDRDALPLVADTWAAERADRLRRARKYNNPGSQPLDRAAPITPETFYLAETDEIPHLPVRESDAIVVGMVAAFQPHFSSDRTFIYTDFTVCVAAIVKGTGRRDRTLVFERAGGSVRLESGKVVSVTGLDGEQAPRVGSRYVFFLRHQDDSPVFTLLRAYKLVAGHVRAMHGGQRRSPFDGMSEVAFLRMVGAQRRE
jgi:hypothetical protein